MTNTYYWLYLILLLLLLYILNANDKIEGFNIVPSNAFVVPKNNIRTLYEQDTVLVNDKFDMYINKGFTLPDYKDTFIKYPYYVKFPYQDFIKNLLLDVFTNLLGDLDFLKGSKFEIIDDMTDIYWKDIEESRHIVFNITLVNKQKIFARKLLVYIVLKDINNYLTDTNEYRPVYKSNKNDFYIKYIKIDESGKNLNLVPNEGINDFDKMYQLKNKYYLSEPFITTREEMEITKKDIQNFKNKLENPTGIVFKNELATGQCYGNIGKAFNKSQCIENDGIWDTIPIDDADCPYYKSNQNYPNSFGKIQGDNCELPKNMKLIGYKNYSKDPQLSPLCYNCKTDKIGVGTMGYCCDKQINKNEYPNLTTPDYVFIGDTTLRNKYKEFLLDKGIEIE